jgi:nitroreductase
MNDPDEQRETRAPAQDDLAFGLDAPLHAVMRTTRAMRRLKPDPVPEELLVGLVEAASWAPSGANTQTYSWLVVTEREQIAALEPLWRKVFELYMSTFARLPSETMAPEQKERMYRAVGYQAEHFREIPALMVACYDMSRQRRGLLGEWRGAIEAGGSLSRGEQATVLRSLKRSADVGEAASIFPAVQNLLLSARALGLGATMTTWHLMLESRFKRVLGIPRTVNTYAIVPVGWPRGRFGPVRRKPVEQAIHWQRW